MLSAMTDVYLNLLVVHLTVGGIAFAAFLVLQESVANAVGDDMARVLWRNPLVRLVMFWMAADSILCLGAAMALAIRPDSMPRWDPGVDFLLSTWPVAGAFALSTIGAVALAALALLRAARMTYPTKAVAELLKAWTLGGLLASPPVRNVQTVREAAIRALQRPRPDDFDRIVAETTTKMVALLNAELGPQRRAEAIGALRHRVFSPLAEEAVRFGRADQAAAVSAAGVTLLQQVAHLDSPGRTQCLGLCEDVRDLLMRLPEMSPDTRRALTDVITHIYEATRAAIAAGSGEGFEDACWAWLPIAKAKPARLLEHDRVVDIGRGDEVNRPIERLALVLQRAEENMWGAKGSSLINPRAWIEVTRELGLGLTQWLASKPGPDMEAEALIVQVMRPVATLGINMAERRCGDEASLAIDPIADVGGASRTKPQFKELPRDAAEWLAMIGLAGEEAGTTSMSGLIAAEAAGAITRSLPLEVGYLKREIPMAGKFDRFDPAVRTMFLARL
jgi:hypothetical protein